MKNELATIVATGHSCNNTRHFVNRHWNGFLLCLLWYYFS